MAVRGALLKRQAGEVSVFVLIWRALLPRERTLAIALFVGQLVAMVLETFSIGLVLPIVGILTSEEYSTNLPIVSGLIESGMSREALVMSALLVMFVAYVAKSALVAALVWFQRGFMSDVSSRLSKKLFANYLHQPYDYHLDHNSSTLIRNSQSASVFVSGGIDPMSTLIADGLVGLGLFALLMYVEPAGTLTVGAVFGFAAWGFQRLTTRRIVKWGNESQEHARAVIQHLNQGLNGVKDVKILGQESTFVDLYADHVESSMHLQRLYKFLQALPRLWLEIITMGALTALVGLMLFQGDEISSVLPVVGLFAATTFRIVPSINRMVASVQSIDFNRPVVREISRDLALDWELDTTSGSCPPIEQSITVRDVSFRYRQSPGDVLSNVTLDIRSGASVGIIGASGAGKSTLVDVILGLLKPVDGNVEVDGFNIAGDPAGWRKQIGYVPQTIYLTDDTIAMNVAFGVHPREVDRDAVDASLRAAMLDEFVAGLPSGANTVVGERGVRLSGGQRQRLGIARALYRNPAVLVLDEATSSLDVETERGVMEAVEALHGQKTIIVIAHRLSTIRYCDWVYRFEKGQMVMQGTYDQVIGDHH
jgi:ABC-type multidrug transport system fused ATPase/permease subunit